MEPRVQFDRAAELTLRTTGEYMAAFAQAKEALLTMGGKLKQEKPDKGVLEAAWRYGINPFGLRVTIQFRTVEGNIIEAVFSGGFADSFDTTGAGKRKAAEVMEAVLTGEAPQEAAQSSASPMPPRLGDPNVPSRGKRKSVAGVLALLLGGMGAHKFYLGNWGIGVVFLISCFVVPGLSMAISLVEAIRLFTLNEDAFNDKYNFRQLTPFQVVW